MATALRRVRQIVRALAPHPVRGLATAAERPPVCLVIGAGRGIGGHVARRFARGGYTAVCVRRSDGGRLDTLVNDIAAEGGRAEGALIDATDATAVDALVERVEQDIGPIECAVYNLGANMGDRSVMIHFVCL